MSKTRFDRIAIFARTFYRTLVYLFTIEKSSPLFGWSVNFNRLINRLTNCLKKILVNYLFRLQLLTIIGLVVKNLLTDNSRQQIVELIDTEP